MKNKLILDRPSRQEKDPVKWLEYAFNARQQNRFEEARFIELIIRKSLTDKEQAELSSLMQKVIDERIVRIKLKLKTPASPLFSTFMTLPICLFKHRPNLLNQMRRVGGFNNE